MIAQRQASRAWWCSTQNRATTSPRPVRYHGPVSKSLVKRAVFQDAKSHKFWEVEVRGDEQIVTYGRVGSSGQSKSKSFADHAAALADAEKKLAGTIKKGYRLEGEAEPTKQEAISEPEVGESFVFDHGIGFNIHEHKLYDGTILSTKGVLEGGVLKPGLHIYVCVDGEERIANVMSVSKLDEGDFATLVFPSPSKLQVQLQVFGGALQSAETISIRPMTPEEELKVYNMRQVIKVAAPAKAKVVDGLARVEIPSEGLQLFLSRLQSLTGTKDADGWQVYFDLATPDGTWLPDLLFDMIPTSEGAPNESLDALLAFGSRHRNAKRDSDNEYQDADDIVCLLLDTASAKVWSYEHEGGFECVAQSLELYLDSLA